MNSLSIPTSTDRNTNGSTVRIRAVDVTGSFEIEDEIQSDTSTSTAAKFFARRMGLPMDAPYTLRTERVKFLDDEKPIGPQLRGHEDEELTVTPKSHLG